MQSSVPSTLFGALKEYLPAQLSYGLRRLKSQMIDEDMRQLRRLAKQYGGDRRVAIDAGIYAGMLSAYFDRVIAIEPHPVCAAYLREVLTSNCTLIEKAASNERGTAKLRAPMSESPRGTISNANRLDGFEQNEISEIDVAVEALDEILPPAILDDQKVALLKIDVEGHELPVLQGAVETVERFRPAILIEVEARHGTPTRDLLGLLTRLGYERVGGNGSGYDANAEGVVNAIYEQIETRAS